MKHMKFFTIFTFLLIILSFSVSAGLSSDCPPNVIYIVDDGPDTCSNRANVIQTIEDLGFVVTTVEDDDLPYVNWSNYDLIIIGDAYLSNAALIPLYDIPTMVMNFNHLVTWNLVASNIPVGFSGSSQPLKMDVNEDNHFIIDGYNGTTVSTYEQAFDCQGKTIVVHHFKRAASTADLIVLATYYFSTTDIEISAFEKDSTLKNGYTANERIVIFGAFDATYWTYETKHIFERGIIWLTEFVDSDIDGTPDYDDNCPCTYNPDQSDIDADGYGDVCDNCVDTYNPGQSNIDQDDLGDACDACPETYGEWCNGCPEISCDICKEPYCPSVGAPYCVNGPDWVPCDDDLFCTVEDMCISGICQGTPRDVDDNISCTDDSCDEEQNVIVNDPNDTYCDNGLFCDGAEYCDIELDCQAGTPPVIDDGISCTDDSCDEENDTIVNTPVDSYCDNTLWCDGFEYCDAQLDCQNGQAPDCSDNLFCTVKESCDEINDKCIFEDRDCSGDDIDPVGQCDYTPDDIDYTYDYFKGFISVCDDGLDACTQGPFELMHTCDMNNCGAECEIDGDCTDIYCTSTHKTYDYGECKNDCTCKGAGGYECIVGNCGALCDEDTDCSCQEDHCEGKDWYDYPDYGKCGTSGAKGCLCQVGEETGELCEPLVTQNHPLCTECQTDEDCNDLDDNYCDGDSIMQVEGVCNQEFVCELGTPTETKDCNDDNETYCDGSAIKHDDYTCEEAACVLDSTILIEECNNGLYCDGIETCEAATCVDAQDVDCSDNNIIGVETCYNTPDDSIDYTYDYRASFTSECNEITGGYECSTGDSTISHECDMQNCEAICEQNSDCPNKCVDEVFFDSGVCLGDCTCDYSTQNCNDLDNWYNTSKKQWININQCNEKEQQEQEYRDYSCTLSGCDYTVTDYIWIDTGETGYKDDGTACDDGLFCTVDDQCIAGTCEGTAMDCSYLSDQCNIGECNETLSSCVAEPVNEGQACDDGEFCNVGETCQLGVCTGGIARDCSANNLAEITTCTNDPDNKDFTWDYAAGFTSTCDEINDICTSSSYDYEHTCNVSECGAECDIQNPCVDKCVGDIYNYNGVCDLDNTCSCSYDTEDCNDLDAWYDTTNIQWVELDQCNEKEQMEQVYVNYSCSLTFGCVGFDQETRWVNTGATRFKQDETPCNDYLFCTENDVCTLGICGGEPVNPDDCVSCTDDYCDEDTDTIVHTPVDSYCDDGQFCNGAEYCDPEQDCQAGEPIDCSANDLAEIATCTNDPDNKDFTWDYAAGFTSECNEADDICTSGSYDYEHTCNVSECGAECDIQNPCVDKCVGDIYNYNGVCDLEDTCSCSYETEDCNQYDGWYDSCCGNYRWIDIDQCNEKKQVQRDYRDYFCIIEGCDFTTTESYVGLTQEKQDIKQMEQSVMMVYTVQKMMFVLKEHVVEVL